MSKVKHWTKEETEYLIENWGQISVPTLCQNLNRSENAIMIKVQKLGLLPFLESGDYITLNQLIIAVTGSSKTYSYKIKSWVEERGLPIHMKLRNRHSFRVVYIDEFWEWAYKNRHYFDFSKMQPLILGEEPGWVAGQRKKDYITSSLLRKDPWTPQDDDHLKHLLKQHRYGFAELSEMLKRSNGAIQRRICDLGLMERPVKAYNHNKWTEQQIQCMVAGIVNGDSYALIAQEVGKSEKAVRGKIYSMFHTEVADRARRVLEQNEVNEQEEISREDEEEYER